MSIKLSDKLQLSGDNFYYFIQVDDQVIGYNESEQAALEFMEEIILKLEKEIIMNNGGETSVKVFRERQSDYNTLISYQTLGLLYNGSITNYANVFVGKVFELQGINDA